MKRAVLLMALATMLFTLSVGIENPTEKEKAPAAYVLQPDYSSPAILVTSVNAIVDVAETGESIAVFAPEAIWTDIVSPVDVKPPIAASANVFINQNRDNPFMTLRVKGRCDSHSGQA